MSISKRMIRILIGSNGGLTGIYLAKQLKKFNVELFGADCSTISTGKFFVDKQFILSNSNSPDFIDELIDLLNSQSIDFYIPTHSTEIRIVSKNEKVIRSNSNCDFIVSPYKTFLALESKRKLSENLASLGIPVPKIIFNSYNNYPILMKQEYGSGGTGLQIIYTEEMRRSYYNYFKDSAVFFELVNGEEFTVDCMFDKQGNLLGYNQRKRIKTIGGAVSITQNYDDFNILPWLKIISNKWHFCGCVNFQYIVKKNVPYFIDVNLRFPSGGLPLTVESGIDIPKLYYNIAKGDVLVGIQKNNKYKTMYRYFEEIFE